MTPKEQLCDVNRRIAELESERIKLYAENQALHAAEMLDTLALVQQRAKHAKGKCYIGFCNKNSVGLYRLDDISVSLVHDCIAVVEKSTLLRCDYSEEGVPNMTFFTDIEGRYELSRPDHAANCLSYEAYPTPEFDELLKTLRHATACFKKAKMARLP